MAAEKAQGPVSEHFDEAYPWEDDKLVVTPKGRGKGTLLREDLRRLPGELVTDDIEDGDRVHALDPEHVRDEVALDAHEKMVSGEEPDEGQPTGVPEWRPVRQDFVDVIILGITKSLLDSASLRLSNGLDHGLRVQHVWFPENDIRVYEMRPGNPPADADRPKHLKNLDIVIDPFCLNERIIKRIQSDPKRLETFRNAIADGFHEQVRLEYLKRGLLL